MLLWPHIRYHVTLLLRYLPVPRCGVPLTVVRCYHHTTFRFPYVRFCELRFRWCYILQHIRYTVPRLRCYPHAHTLPRLFAPVSTLLFYALPFPIYHTFTRTYTHGVHLHRFIYHTTHTSLLHFTFPHRFHTAYDVVADSSSVSPLRLHRFTRSPRSCVYTFSRSATFLCVCRLVGFPLFHVHSIFDFRCSRLYYVYVYYLHTRLPHLSHSHVHTRSTFTVGMRWVFPTLRFVTLLRLPFTTDVVRI